MSEQEQNNNVPVPAQETAPAPVQEKRASIYDVFETDTNDEVGGIWLDFPNGASFKVARMGGSNKGFNRVFRRRTKAYKNSLDSMPDEMLEQISVDAFVDGCLLDWEGIVGRDGVEIPFSKENATKLLKDLPELRDNLINEARNFENFRKESVDEVAKN